jgi:hypothetical protein
MTPGPSSSMLEHFAEQFLDAAASDTQHLPSERRHMVQAAVAAVVPRQPRLEVSQPLHTVEDRIQRAGTEAIAVVTELIHHPLAEDGPFGCVVQDVKTNQTIVQASIFHRFPIAYTDIGNRCEFGGSPK